MEVRAPALCLQRAEVVGLVMEEMVRALAPCLQGAELVGPVAVGETGALVKTVGLPPPQWL